MQIVKTAAARREFGVGIDGLNNLEGPRHDVNMNAIPANKMVEINHNQTTRQDNADTDATVLISRVPGCFEIGPRVRIANGCGLAVFGIDRSLFRLTASGIGAPGYPTIPTD